MAHAILAGEALKRSLDIDIYSAGTVDFSDQPPLDETSRTCLWYETPPPKLTPTWVGQLPLDSIDRFLVMEQNHLDALENQFGISADRIALLGSFDPKQRGAEIPDPFFSFSEEVYRSSYLRIRDCIIEYLNTENERRGNPLDSVFLKIKRGGHGVPPLQLFVALVILSLGARDRRSSYT